MSKQKKIARPGKRSSKRGRLSSERILQQAVAMAKEAGLEALSMRGLAGHLGVEAMSLYHYVPNKDALIDAMVDRMVGEVALPGVGGAWQKQMRRRALSALDVMMRHPWVVMPLLSRINTGPRMLTYTDHTHGCLLAAGFSHREADWARNLMDSHIYGFALQEVHFPIGPEDYASSAEKFLPLIPALRYPHLRGIAEAVISGEYDGRNSFGFGLEIILDGLAQKLGAGGHG